jgi:hypothetical protein
MIKNITKISCLAIISFNINGMVPVLLPEITSKISCAAIETSGTFKKAKQAFSDLSLTSLQIGDSIAHYKTALNDGPSLIEAVKNSNNAQSKKDSLNILNNFMGKNNAFFILNLALDQKTGTAIDIALLEIYCKLPLARKLNFGNLNQNCNNNLTPDEQIIFPCLKSIILGYFQSKKDTQLKSMIPENKALIQRINNFLSSNTTEPNENLKPSNCDESQNRFFEYLTKN